MVPTTNPTRGRVNDTTVEAGRGRHGRRRPSGEPPPLPREDRWTRWIWVLAAVLLLGAALNVLIHTTDVVQRMDQTVLDWFAQTRTPALTDAAKLVVLLTTFAAVMVLRIGTVLVLVLYRRFRHLVVFLVTLVVTDWVVVRLLFVELPSPTVPVLVDVDGYAFPLQGHRRPRDHAVRDDLRPRAARQGSQPGSARGSRRDWCWWSWPSSTSPPTTSRPWCTPRSSSPGGRRGLPVAGPGGGLPITYQTRGSAAHLDLGGKERGRAIVRAMGDQLGLSVTEVKEFGLEGSGRLLAAADDAGGRQPGVRQDLLHQPRAGRPLVPVRPHHPLRPARGRDRDRLGAPPGRLRGLRPSAAGRPRVRVARTYGLVELTPNQEYMLVMEFFENARNLGDSEIDDTVIDEGLVMVRTFWDIGVAHRDIKPANLLVRDGHLQLVDVSALEVRPSPCARRSTCPTCSWSSPCGPTRSGCMPAPPRCSPPTRSPRPARRRSA